MRTLAFMTLVSMIWLLNDQCCLGFRSSLLSLRVRCDVLSAQAQRNNDLNPSRVVKESHEGKELHHCRFIIAA